MALKRLADAERDGDHILGVIRGVGLSNDGRQSGILAPAASGQTAAMRDALAQAGLTPADVDYVDCHATGTVLGDATELESLREAYGDAPLKLGALKGNLGHTITVSGAASLVNVLSAMEAGTLPPSLCDTQTPALADTPFTLVTEPTRWDGAVKTAAVSNFGFGGNNAHLIVQNYVPAEHRAPAVPPAPPAGDIVICGLGAVTGDTADADDFRRRALGAEAEPSALDQVQLELVGLGFPPSELKGSLAQQTTVLAASAQALREISTEGDRTGVVIGMGCDAMIGRQRLRVLHADDDAWLTANAASAPQLTADGVVGTMPNIPANRIHAQRDFRGFGFTVSSEELSGITALKVAARALRSGELDTVVAGAVDLCREPAHERAADAVTGAAGQHGDAAVVFVLKRRADAVAAGEPILAVLETDTPDTDTPGAETRDAETRDAESAAFAHDGFTQARFGRTHAASAAVEIAAQVMALGSRVRVEASGAQPAPGRDSAQVRVAALGGRTDSIGVRVDVDAPAPLARGPLPISERYAAASRAELLEALRRAEPGGDGPVRCAVVADNPDTLAVLRRGAADQLARGDAPAGPGILFAEAPISGEIGFAFTGAAAAYPGAGREMLLAWPEVAEALAHRFPGGADLVPQLHGDDITGLDAYFQLTGCAVVCQTQAEFSRTVLGLQPSAAIGLSSGETNSLMAFGVWRDLQPMLAEIVESGMYGQQITGECRIAGEAWGNGSTPTDWECWRISAPREQIDAALAAEPRAYMTIVQAPDDCVIGGDPQACKRVIEALGNPPNMYLGLDMVIHCEAMTPFTDVWHRIHSRETFEAPGIRFYSNGHAGAYTPTREAAADAITRQALEPIDFPATVRQAYDDGVRVFIEHGPRGTLTAAITKILGDRPHLAVALDAQERRGLRALAEAVSKLWVHGVPVALEGFDNRIAVLRDQQDTDAAAGARTLSFAGHWPDIVDGAAPSAAPAQRPATVPARSSVAPPQHTAIKTKVLEPVTVSPATVLSAQNESAPMSAPDAVGVSAVAADTTPAQHMAPAPSYPPAVTLPQTVVTQTEYVSVPGAAGAPAAPAAAVGDQTAAALGVVEAVSGAQSAFVERQAQAHAAFLETRAAMLAMVARRRGELPGRIVAGAVAPSPVVTAPAVTAPALNTAVSAPAPQAVPAPQSVPASQAAPAPASPAPAVKAPAPQAPAAPAPAAPAPAAPEKVLFTRAQLEVLAGGNISEVFGPEFAEYDQYERLVRMPEPPLLFADRVISIDGEPGTMKTGTIVTETDVDPDAWYMHNGRMSPGVVIESGQADLLLASWLGADFTNRSERVYRLLGCDLTFMGELPKGGETLHYVIHIDGHAKTGDTRLFFFHYDCYIGDRLMISVRNGQAGFFSDAELADSDGVLWDAADDAPREGARRDTPPQVTTKRSFSADELTAYVEGHAYTCFGEGFERAAAHSRTPSLPKGPLRLFDEIAEFDPEGGPWGRGYLRARAHVPADSWFYNGHFKNDPCMPGTLMADAATQALSFAMAAYGFTIEHDGWRFEPVPDEMSRFVCRGQVIPDADHTLDYEVFIEEIVDGPIPTVYAALLCRSDGFKVFHARRFGIRLVPDWPMPPGAPGPVHILEGTTDVRGDYGALLACGRGMPSDAFGELYKPFDGTRRAPRLPDEPYHFVSRIISVDSPPGVPTKGGTCIAEYDVPADAWYLADTHSDAVPLSVLIEILLQPCGWLSSYNGFAANRPDDVLFRNLDGKNITQLRPAKVGTLRVSTTMERFAEGGGSTICFFDVVCTQNDEVVMTMNTAFGFFKPEAMENQVGLKSPQFTLDGLNAEAPVNVEYLGPELSGAPYLHQGRLQVLDRVKFWPGAGEAGLGRAVAIYDVHPEAWFFKAHFFQDPVQPGSLGLEAMQQCARAAARLAGVADGATHFEQVAHDQSFDWSFRGQVTPLAKLARSAVEILSVDTDERGTLVVFNGTFWVDDLCIYETKKMGVRAVRA